MRKPRADAAFRRQTGRVVRTGLDGGEHPCPVRPVLRSRGIKMGKLGMPLRLAVCGTAKTPSVDAVLALMGKEEVLKRLAQ